MKVLFIIPRSLNPKQMYLEYPLGVGLIGTILQSQGTEVIIYDQNAEGGSNRSIIQLIEDIQPDIIAFSLITPNYPVAQKLISNIKSQYPNVLVVSGGLHSTLFPEDLIRDGVDIVVCGEGEYSMPIILESYRKDNGFSNLPGVKKWESGYIVETWADIIEREKKSPSIVDRNLFNLEKYTHHSMFASVGCPFHCNFCCNYSGTILTKGCKSRCYSDVIKEMIYLRDSFGAKEIFFVDDIFFISKSEAEIFCKELIKLEVGISWISQMRADRIDIRLAELMFEAGCRRIYFGVESGSEDILESSRKRITKDQIRRGIQATREAGIRVKTGWIYGLPGTIKQQYSSLDFMLELQPNEISVHILIPFPGTEYYRNPQKYGIQIKDKKDFESFCYGGLSDNINFDYLSKPELIKLFENTAERLEAGGYISSDKVSGTAEFVYSTPFSSKSMQVFPKRSN